MSVRTINIEEFAVDASFVPDSASVVDLELDPEYPADKEDPTVDLPINDTGIVRYEFNVDGRTLGRFYLMPGDDTSDLAELLRVGGSIKDSIVDQMKERIAAAGTGGGGGSVASDVIWNAKGDLAAGTGANTANRVGVGANDTFLVPDSGIATGLKWINAAAVKTILALAKGDVGLGNVDNTADTAKPVSTAQQTALDLKANLASPTFTGTVGGITKSMVGLGSVDNTADSAKPVSTAQQAAIDAKVTANAGITGATKTKVTYDAKGLVTAGADATTADIADSANKRYVTDANLTVIGNTSGTNTGDQTSIVGITGTKAQFDTACSDGNFLYSGDVTQYTDEMAQDAVGAMVADTATIDVTYTDATPELKFDVKANSITEAMHVFADNTTGNVTSAAHGYAPKSPADATKFLNGAATPAFAQVKDSDLSTSDITTNDVSTTKHGFVPKAPNNVAQWLRGDGAWAALVDFAYTNSSTTSNAVTLTSSNYNSLIFWSPTNTATMTLPANGAPAGTWIRVSLLTNQTVTISAATADTLITLNDTAADSVAFSTASAKIGAMVEFISNGTVWVAVNLSNHTMTVAT